MKRINSIKLKTDFHYLLYEDENIESLGIYPTEIDAKNHCINPQIFNEERHNTKTYQECDVYVCFCNGDTKPLILYLNEKGIPYDRHKYWE